MTKDQKNIIKTALDQPENLTEWEYEFISSVAEEENDYELSDRQVRVLDRIETKLDF